MTDPNSRRSRGRDAGGSGIGGLIIAFFIGGVIMLAAVAGLMIWFGGREVIVEKAAGVEVPVPSLPDAPLLPDTPTLPPLEPPTLPSPGPQPAR